MIKVNNLDFHHNDKPVLRDISFSISGGESVAIVGPNGAGKTTLLKCLGRLLRVQDRKILIKNRWIYDYGQSELARIIGYVPQGSVGHALPYTVQDFVAMGRYPYQRFLSPESKEDRRTVQEALELTSMDSLRHRYMFELSGGEQQKAHLAAALAQSPEILLLDEPGAHLDPGWNAEIHKVLRRVNKEQTVTLVSVTHDLNTALTGFNKVLALKEGTIHYFDKSSGLADDTVLQELFNHPFTILDHPERGKRILPEVLE